MRFRSTLFVLAVVALIGMAVRTDIALAQAEASAPAFIDLSSLPDVSGQLIMTESFESKHIRDRPLYIWLPPSYGKTTRRYPVIYMLDGEHMFINSLAKPTRTEWEVDETLTRLIQDGQIREAIIVAIPSGGSRRYDEYVPQEPMQKYALQMQLNFQSDEHRQFLTEEVKPFIDQYFPTRPEREDTYLLGASVSGLTVMEVLINHPDMFGAVAAMSPHLSLADGGVVRWLNRELQVPDTHRFYMDRGTKGLDAQYARGFRRLRNRLLELGYVEDDNFQATIFKGAAHTADAFRDRMHAPLLFLLAPEEGDDHASH